MGSFSLIQPWEPQTRTTEIWDGFQINQGSYIQRISPHKSAVLILNTRSDEHKPGSIITLDFKTESRENLYDNESLTGLWSAFQTWRKYDEILNKIMTRRASKIFHKILAEYPFYLTKRKIRLLEGSFPGLLARAMDNYQNLLRTFSPGDFISFACLWNAHSVTAISEEMEDALSRFKDNKRKAQIKLYLEAKSCLNVLLKSKEAKREQLILYMGSENPTLAYEQLEREF